MRIGLDARDRAALLLTTTVVAAGFVITTGTVPVQAQSAMEQTYRFDIAAKPVRQALNDVSRVTGVSVVFSEATASSVTGNTVSGVMTREQAITALLAGTGLSYSFTNADTVTIVDRVEQVFNNGIPNDGSLVLDTIDVSAGGNNPSDLPYQTAGSSNYLSSEEVQRYRGTSVGDFLSGTPGVMNGDNRNGAALDVNIRGMQGQGRVPVIIDGAQQESTVWRGYAGVAGRSYVDPDFIGGVEIEKGPSSSADAPGAIGGAVRMNTLTVDDILLPGKNFGLRLKGGFNTNSSSVPSVGTKGGYQGEGTYTGTLPTSFAGPDGMERPAFLEPTGGSGSAAAGYRSEYLDLVFAYARRKNGNYHAGTHGDAIPHVNIDYGTPTTVSFEGLNWYRAGEEVLNTSQDNTSYLTKAKLRLPADQELEITYMRYESDYGEMMPSQIVRSNGQGAYQSWLNSVEMESYTARYGWDPVDNDWFDVEARLWLTDTDLVVPYQTYSTEQNPPVGYGNAYGNNNLRWGFNAQNQSELDTAIGEFSLRFGGSYTSEDMTPAAEANVVGTRDGWRRETSVFGSLDWAPTSWLKLSGSLRYTDFEAQDRNPYSTSQDVHKGDGIAPIFSATLEPVEGVQIYGKYAEAIRLPSLFELTKGFSTYMPSNFALEPERAKNWEFGMNVLREDLFFEGDKFRLKASYFDNHVDNYITRIMGPLGFDAAIVNVDYAELRGFELGASYDAGHMFSEFAWTHYTHTDYCTKPGQVGSAWASELCYSGGVPNGYVLNHVPPKDSLALTLGARFLEERLTVGGRLTYVGERPVSYLGGDAALPTGSLLTHVEWDPYMLVDLFADYKVNDRLQLSAAVDNVGDVYYMDALTLGLMPSPGRTFRASLTAKF